MTATLAMTRSSSTVAGAASGTLPRTAPGSSCGTCAPLGATAAGGTQIERQPRVSAETKFDFQLHSDYKMHTRNQLQRTTLIPFLRMGKLRATDPDCHVLETCN